jgi:hypothetical protein
VQPVTCMIDVFTECLSRHFWAFTWKIFNCDKMNTVSLLLSFGIVVVAEVESYVAVSIGVPPLGSST